MVYSFDTLEGRPVAARPLSQLRCQLPHRGSQGRILDSGSNLPPPLGPIPLIKGKCPEGTKGIGKVVPQGPDEGGSRWVHIPPAGGWGHPPLRRVTIDFVGAAVPSGPPITGVPPWSPSSVMAYGRATFSPAGRRL